MHSQRLNEKYLSPWIIAKVDGQIECSHCDCVAGLGEVCTHVAAVPLLCKNSTMIFLNWSNLVSHKQVHRFVTPMTVLFQAAAAHQFIAYVRSLMMVNHL